MPNCYKLFFGYPLPNYVSKKIAKIANSVKLILVVPLIPVPPPFPKMKIPKAW